MRITHSWWRASPDRWCRYWRGWTRGTWRVPGRSGAAQVGGAAGLHQVRAGRRYHHFRNWFWRLEQWTAANVVISRQSRQLGEAGAELYQLTRLPGPPTGSLASPWCLPMSHDQAFSERRRWNGSVRSHQQSEPRLLLESRHAQALQEKMRNHNESRSFKCSNSEFRPSLLNEEYGR